jgi:hypothetical protein
VERSKPDSDDFVNFETNKELKIAFKTSKNNSNIKIEKRNTKTREKKDLFLTPKKYRKRNNANPK